MNVANTPHLNTPSTGYESRRIIGGKTFRVLSGEIVIEKPIDDVWKEVSGNFVNGAEIAASLNSSHGLSGDLTEGLGAKRYLNIDFSGQTIEAKERIIDFRNAGDVREFTYEVYDTKGAPLALTSYNTWFVQKRGDDKTCLGSVFIFRAKPAFLTGIVSKKFAQSGSLRVGLLTYKHYLETGEKKVAASRLNEMYPS